MKLIFPVKLAQAAMLFICLYLLLRTRRLCAERGEEEAVQDLKELVSNESHDCHVILANHIDFYLFERAENETEEQNETSLTEDMAERKKREMRYVLPAAPEFPNKPGRQRREPVKKETVVTSEEDTTTTTKPTTTTTSTTTSTTTTTTVPEVKTMAVHVETTPEEQETKSITTAAKEYVKESVKEEEVGDQETTAEAEEHRNITEKAVNHTKQGLEGDEMMEWARMYTHRGSRHYMSCLTVYTGDVLGLADSPLIQRQLVGARMATIFFIFDLVILLCEIVYFYSSNDTPTRLGSLMIGGLHCLLVGVSAGSLAQMRFAWADKAWGPLLVPDHPSSWFTAEVSAWSLMVLYMLLTIFYRRAHSEVLLIRSPFGSYEVADQETRSTYIAAYEEPIEDRNIISGSYEEPIDGSHEF